jgi:integrase
MAVVARKRARSTVYFVVTRGNWERVGTDRRESERLNARRKAELKAGTYKPDGGTGKQSVRAYAEKWLAGRKVKAAETEAQLMRDYVLRTTFADLRIEDVRPRHVIALIEELHRAAPVSGRTPTLSRKTVANIAGVLKTMFRDAVIGEAVAADPVVLPRGTLSRKGKQRAPYEAEAAARAVWAARHPARRVFAALALYTGMREGEVCGRRWRDYDATSEPLGALLVATQYDDEPLKTDSPRRVPVHPELAALLDQWKAEGWELVYRRRPTPDDFIVPPPRTPGACYTKSGAYQMWRQNLRETGVTNLSLHSTRHTFLTLARRGGAREEVIERVTHNARGSMVDQYTHWDWAPLCEAVLCFPFLRKIDTALRQAVDAHRQLASFTAPAPGLEPRHAPEPPDVSRPETAPSGAERAPIAREIADGGAELAAGQDSEPRSAARADETQTGDRLPLPAHVLAGGQGAVRTEHSCATHSPAAWGLAEVAGRLGVLL